MSGKRVQTGESSGLSAVARPILISVVFGIMVCIGVLMLLSFVLSVRSVPHSLINPLAVFAISVGALTAGFCCAKLLRQGGLAYGALCGGVFSLVIMLASFGISDNGFGLTALFKITFMMLSAMLGGVFGVNMRRKRK
ncbi:MAG: TIGR04086 family membrane protein [Oscillospiraceae bacterium]|nr:TIGR04086 family membrane protein [Oscillospiraceae bacterium]